MTKKKKEIIKEDVQKDVQIESNLQKPTTEEINQYKIEFEEAIKNFHETQWVISDASQFSANETGLFLMEYLKKYASWNKTGWMGILKMKEELENSMKIVSQETESCEGLKLDYQALEFCGYMLMNPAGVGYENALEFEKMATVYSNIMIEVGHKIDEARETLKHIQWLQERWAAGEQGFYLAELESSNNKNEEDPEDLELDSKK